MQNPYQPPTAEQSDVPLPTSRPDYAILAGWYFRFLAAVSVGACLTIYLTRGIFVTDWTPILTLWVGHLLIHRSSTARSWVIVICSTFAVLSIFMVVISIFAGTENLSFAYGSMKIESPSIGLAAGLLCGTSLIFGIPVFLLANQKAWQQFNANNAG